MMDALYIAATGMHAEQAQLATISNNLANMNTTAFKKSTVVFDDLMYRDSVTSSSSVDQMTNGVMVGMGSGVASINKDFSVGDLRATDNPLDIAIRGLGFIEVDLGNGEFGFTRSGAMKIDSDGYLSTVSGERLSGNIQIPQDASDIFIQANGDVAVRINGEDELLEVGRIELVSFLSPTSLAPSGNNLYLSTEETGAPIFSVPGEDGTGMLAQGFLEGSNVSLVEEMMSLVATQRAYESNSQVIRATDEM
ncbi:MAG: flagellar basal-body rod protein FlgG, partial [Cryomorphaceae bacterium]